MEALNDNIKKLALLIGSSYGGLPGTENDVATMAEVLRGFKFPVDDPNYVKRLCGNDASRKNILQAWDDMIKITNWGDAVVIYYSGHGGLAQPAKRNDTTSSKQLKHIQFLVPTDFESSSDEWLGIMDDVISNWLLRTTGETPNVTYILDCCHSARLGRGPRTRSEAIQKQSSFDYNSLAKHQLRLSNNKLLLENEFWTNPDVVRIAAAADLEPAWQYRDSEGKHVGVLTEKLSQMMKDPGSQLSWRNIMLGTKALVERAFDGDDFQKPRSAGADTRIPFSLDRGPSSVLLAEVGPEFTTISGGRVHGLLPGDVYSLVPFRANGAADDLVPAAGSRATIWKTDGFKSVALDVSTENFPHTEVLALPYSRRRRWPMSVSGSIPHANEFLDKSLFFRRSEGGEKAIAEFKEGAKSGEVLLFAGRNQLGSGEANNAQNVKKLISVAHMFADAQALLSLDGGTRLETFKHGLKVEMGAVDQYERVPRLNFSAKYVYTMNNVFSALAKNLTGRMVVPHRSALRPGSITISTLSLMMIKGVLSTRSILMPQARSKSLPMYGRRDCIFLTDTRFKHLQRGACH